MAYVPDWKWLFDALKSVIAVGVSADKAKLGITNAIVDRKIPVRLTVESDADPVVRWNRMVLQAKGLDSGQNNSIQAVEYFEGADIGIPSHLTPHDFDWENSRPRNLWSIRPREWPIEPRDWRSIERRTFVWPRRIVSRIAVRTAAVTRFIDEITKSAHGGIASSESTSSAPSDHAVARSIPSMPRDNAAGNGPSLLKRDGVPPTARKKKSQPDRERALRVIEELFPGGVPDQATLPNRHLCKRVNDRLEKHLPVSKDTILRAAGRRIDRK
jgi:hypothetical protein